MAGESYRRAFLVLALSVGLISCAGEDFGRPQMERLLPTEYALELLGMEEAWHCGIGHQPVRNVYVLNGLICLETKQRKLYAIETQTGLVKWQYKLDFLLEYPPCDNEDSIFLLVGDRLYALAKHNGHVQWHRPLDFHPSAGPAANVGLVVVPSRFMLETFEVIDGSLAWKMRLRGHVFHPPTAAGDHFFTGDAAGWAYGINARFGQKMWELQTGGPIGVSPSPMPGIVYVGSDDYKVYSLDAATGAVRWEKSTGDIVQAKPLGTADAVYVQSRKNGVLAYCAASGMERWHDKEATKVLAVGAKRAYLLGTPGVIRAVGVTNGQMEKRISAKQYKFFPTNHHTDHLLLVTDLGTVVALREKCETCGKSGSPAGQ